MKSTVRVRLAFSPAAQLNIGDLRLAILNWIIAQQQQGAVVLRIEDQDSQTSSPSLENELYDQLEWVGLSWDEGPVVGGKYGPYRQTKRLAVYQEYFNKLKAKDVIYPCCKTAEEITELKKNTARKTGATSFTRDVLQATEYELRLAEEQGKHPAWFYSVGTQDVTWTDLAQGELLFPAANLDDFLVVHADRLQDNIFTDAVDDALMNISHLVLNENQKLNTARRILLGRSLDLLAPQFGHVPPLLGQDNMDMYTDNGPVLIKVLKESGYAPEALISCLALLDDSANGENEIVSLDTLVSEFSFERISQSRETFDFIKLNSVSGHCLRAFPFNKFKAAVQPYLKKSGLDYQTAPNLNNILFSLQGSIDYLAQAEEMIEPFCRESIQPTIGEAITVSSSDISQKVYWTFLRYLNNFDHVDADIFRKIMQDVQKETGIMGKELWLPIRVAFTGKIHGPNLATIAEILGKSKIVKFIQNRLD